MFHLIVILFKELRWHAGVSVLKKNVEKTTAPSEGSPAGSVSSSQKYYNGCIPDGLGESGRGVWSEEQWSWHINRLELLAVFLALRQFLLQLTDCHVLIRKDNMMVVSYLNRQGGLNEWMNDAFI